MSSQKVRTLLSERTSLRTIIASIVILVIGIFLLYLASDNTLWANQPNLHSITRDIGSMFVASIAITFLWELAGKRAFLDELLSKARLAEEIRASGIIKFTNAVYQEVDWHTLFKNSNELDIFFAYGRTWRNAHAEELRNLAAKRSAKIRVVLPDPNSDNVIDELSKRFNCSHDDMKGRILEAEKFFRQLQGNNIGKGNKAGKLDIWFLPYVPLYNFYRFDHNIILSLYTHRRERVAVPTFVLEDGGEFYEFIQNEFDAMVRENGLGRHIINNMEKSNEQ